MKEKKNTLKEEIVELTKNLIFMQNVLGFSIVRIWDCPEYAPPEVLLTKRNLED